MRYARRYKGEGRWETITEAEARKSLGGTYTDVDAALATLHEYGSIETCWAELRVIRDPEPDMTSYVNDDTPDEEIEILTPRPRTEPEDRPDLAPDPELAARGMTRSQFAEDMRADCASLHPAFQPVGRFG